MEKTQLRSERSRIYARRAYVSQYPKHRFRNEFELFKRAVRKDGFNSIENESEINVPIVEHIPTFLLT